MRTGRPPLPKAPENAADCRTLIARETVRTTPRERTLRHLYKLLRAFVAAEEVERQDRRIVAQNKANELKAAELEVKRSEYRRRFTATEHGRRALLTMVERLERELATLGVDSNQKAGDRACQ